MRKNWYFMNQIGILKLPTDFRVMHPIWQMRATNSFVKEKRIRQNHRPASFCLFIVRTDSLRFRWMMVKKCDEIQYQNVIIESIDEKSTWNLIGKHFGWWLCLYFVGSYCEQCWHQSAEIRYRTSINHLLIEIERPASESNQEVLYIKLIMSHHTKRSTNLSILRMHASQLSSQLLVIAKMHNTNCSV